ncbi:hypothetical protein K491DRAFT_425487 [Lophiostoma macrostomum CBS 122681]|uniref:Uncharacterized protein n=1 Tax=Lophiostoma macrostomum CBS 122681 TaxID=1314788 RepID=A0A6A6T633_9PLEO|nr:hypothetical protein K491DRAFT_425487 [Lophiostoma macrostomum CBS 122681]
MGASCVDDCCSPRRGKSLLREPSTSTRTPARAHKAVVMRLMTPASGATETDRTKQRGFVFQVPRVGRQRGIMRRRKKRQQEMKLGPHGQVLAFCEPCSSARQDDCTKTSSPPRSRSPSSEPNSGAARRADCAHRCGVCASAACLRCARRSRRRARLLFTAGVYAADFARS